MTDLDLHHKREGMLKLVISAINLKPVGFTILIDNLDLDQDQDLVFQGSTCNLVAVEPNEILNETLAPRVHQVLHLPFALMAIVLQCNRIKL
jgi:hypothetical protein